MAILPLVRENDPILKQEGTPFDFSNPQINPIELAENLTETVIYNNGLGLTANQVGLPYKVFVLKSNPVLVCFNPKILDISSEEETLDEANLSFRGLILRVKRPKIIKCRFQYPNGQLTNEKFIGMTSRVFQQCYQTINGILFTDLVSKLELDIAKRKMKKRMKK